ncbi:MAG: GerAB/ArcD/ProY family transporter [Butyricicoccaceae bacterium]
MPQKLTGHQAGALVFLYLTGWSLTMGAQAGRDGWCTILLAALLFLPVCAVFLRPSTIFPGKTLFEVHNHVLGGVLGRLFTLVYLIFALWTLCDVVSGFAAFLTFPPLWTAAALLISGGVLASLGPYRLAQWAEPVVWVTAIVLIASLVLTLSVWDFGELLPLLRTNVQDLGAQSLRVLCEPFFPALFAVGLLFGTGRLPQLGVSRAVVLSGLLLASVYLRNLCLLGLNTMQSVQSPTYAAASLIELGESFQRGEVLISCALALCDILRCAVLLCFLAEGCRSIVPALPRPQCVAVLTLLAFAGAALCGGRLYSELLYPLMAVFFSVMMLILWTASEAVRKFGKSE